VDPETVAIMGIARDGTGVATMAAILPFLRRDEGVFDPKDITAMSMALDDICKELNLRDDSAAREVIAVRIINLAKIGERSPARLRDRVLQDTHMAQRANLDDAREA
jgi:hypothetical protein